MMNKILVDGDSLVITEKIKKIEVNGNAIIYIPNLEFDLNLVVKLNEFANLEINDFNTNNKCVKIEITHTSNSVVNYNHTFKIIDDYKLNYIVNMNGDNNTNCINVTGISKGKVYIDIDGIIGANTSDNNIFENVKILTIGGKAKVSPMLHVNSKNCIVNHNTAISNVRKDELFYLNSKGISNQHAIELIENGYLYGLFKNDHTFLEMINYMGGDTNE